MRNAIAEGNIEHAIGVAKSLHSDKQEVYNKYYARRTSIIG